MDRDQKIKELQQLIANATVITSSGWSSGWTPYSRIDQSKSKIHQRKDHPQNPAHE
jgi:hypothetical protein